jgi:predicted glutamine amidotransferase
LYYSREVSELIRINPAIKDRLTSTARIVVSEPIGKFKEMWEEVQQGSVVIVREGNIETQSFKPTAPKS